MSEITKMKKQKKFPHVYVILLSVVVICAIFSYFAPAGQYNRIENEAGRMVVDPTSYHVVESTPVGLFDVLKSIPAGMVETAEIIFFIFIVGGAFAVVNATGAFEAGIGKVTKVMAGREKLIIPIVMFVFSLGGAVFGMAEETLPFIPIMVTLAIALGFDSLTGVAMVLAGAGAGFSGAFMNPFTIGVAQGICGLPLFSGMGFRIVVYIVFVIVTTTLVYLYASHIKKNPEKSIMYEFDKSRDDILDLHEIKELTSSHKLVLLTVLGTIGLLIFGVIKYGWYIQEISALFLGMAVVVSFVGKLGLNGFAEELVKGMCDLAGGALVVGFARAILVVLTQSNLIDTLLYTTSNMVSNLPSSLTAVGIYVFQCLLSYVIPSGGGQAAVSMPIMSPLADIVGVTRQTAVLAYQFGDGISNIFTPTSGYFMAGLAMAKVPWNKWAKWFFPIIAIQYAIGAIFVIIANVINYGPF